ncbi:MAG: CotH kinase family protein [Flavobacteriales bacterium]|nr:CotH kinase family protein [Flavobacteriales bacterium]
MFTERVWKACPTEAHPNNPLLHAVLHNIPLTFKHIGLTLCCTLMLQRTAAQVTQVVFINEVMASNDITITDATGEHADWVEIFNPSATPYDLSGHWLSDDANLPLKYQLPNSPAVLTIPAGGFLLLWASGLPGNGPSHLSFSLSASGEHVSLATPDGTTLIDSITFGAQLTDVAFGRELDGSQDWLFFTSPTPLLSNASSLGALGFLQAPAFSHPSGFQATDFHVTFSHPDPGVTIYYSLDGSDPGPDRVNGEVYTYKDRYPENPGQPFGPLLNDTMRAFVATGPVLVTDQSGTPNRWSARTTTFSHNYPPSYMPVIPVRKGTVLKARAYKPGFIPSAVEMRTYFITPGGTNPYPLPVIALAADAEHLFSYQNGLYTAGVDFDAWRTNNPSATTNGATPANWRRAEVEHPLNLSYFESAQDTSVSEHRAGFRLHGGWTKAHPRKSLRIYFRSNYGRSTMEYPLFPTAAEPDPKRFIVRNSGNDEYLTNLRDLSMQAMVRHMRFDTQHGHSGVLFLNGEFWGVHDLRERYDRHYIERKYGIQQNELDLIENPYIIVEGDAVHYDALLNYVSSADMTLASTLEYVGTQADLDNLIDYYSAEIFIGNTDWPHNNVKLFRKRLSAYDPEALPGQDGRWRWILFDTDFGFGILPTRQADFDYLGWALHPTGNGFGSWSNRLFRRLVLNNTFRNAFINRHADMLNTAYASTRTTAILTQLRDLILPTMQAEHFDRWRGRPGSMSTWNFNLSTPYTFSQQRPTYARQEVLAHFSLPGMQEITVDVSDPTHGHVRVNTIDILPSTPGVDPLPYPWTGLYYQSVPITLTAQANTGFEFLFWEGDVSSTSVSITLDLTDTTFVRAVFGVREVCVDTVLHYWHFNNLPNNALSSVEPDESLVPGALITYPGTGAGFMDRSNTSEGSDLNALTGVPSGRALRVRNPSDTRELIIAAPSTGHRDVVLSYATMRTTNGAQQQSVAYTIDPDQNNWVPLPPNRLVGLDFEVFTFRLEDSTATYDNPHLAFRIRFGGSNASGASGNNRFDNLLVRAAPIPRQHAILCTDSTFNFLGNTYTTAGNYLLHLPDSGHCAEFIILDLEDFQVDTSVTVSDGTLYANTLSDSYQWVDCLAGLAPVAGATGPTFIPDTNGTFAVQGTTGGCPWMSQCHTVIGTGMATPPTGVAQVYPNPANDNAWLLATDIAPGTPCSLHDQTGREVWRAALTGPRTELPLARLASGIYVLRIAGANELHLRVVRE